MVKGRVGLLVLLLCFCICLWPCYVQAASTSDAVEPIVPEQECTLTISYGYEDTAFSNVEVQLYKIATVSADYQYTLSSAFAGSGLILNGVKTNGEWNVIRSTLEAYILANALQPDHVAHTQENGEAHFPQLGTGLYLAVVGEVEQAQLRYDFDTALIALPGLNVEDRWQYDVEVTAKGTLLPPVDPDEQLQWKVLKLWKGDEGSASRPRSVEVEIFCNGVSQETVILSEENYWSYSWSAPDDGASWMVVERNIPGEYTMLLEQRGTTFVLTNHFQPEDPDIPDIPPTGDTSNILMYIVGMLLCGSVLTILGLVGKRRSL